MEIKVNGKVHKVDVPEDVPLLWVLREELSLLGTKFGCGQGLCGACTVHLNGAAVRSCSVPVIGAIGGEVTTIEGLGSDDGLNPLQQAWLENNTPQCGYCQVGQLMSAAALLKQKPNPSEAEVIASMNGNICRCGTYQRIRAAIAQVATDGRT